MTPLPPPFFYQRYRRQRGISLITTLVILLLSLVAVLGAYRVTNINESMLSNTADYSRARTAAEALVRDAEIDILGRRPPYDIDPITGTIGYPCRPFPTSSTTSLVSEAGYVGCRNQATASTPWFPQSSDDFDDMQDITLANSTTYYCKQGICVPPDTTTLQNIENILSDATKANTMKALGVTYGSYTRNLLAAPGVSGNPVLSANPAQAWYWVEAFRYQTAAADPAITNLIPDNRASFVFRITAIAYGLKPGTRVVIRSIFVPYPKSQG